MAKTAADLFATAPTAPAAPKVESKSKSKKTVALTGKWEEKENAHDLFAAAKAIADAATGFMKTLEGEVKKETKKIFTEMGMTLGKKPESFEGTSAHANSNCQLRQRASTSPLTPEEIRIARENNIPLEEKVIRAEIPERFFFNEDLLSNPKYRYQISKALGKIDFGGQSPIIRQAPEEKVVAYITAENSIDALFNGTIKKDDHAFETGQDEVAKVQQLMSLVGVLALKTQFTGSLKDAFELLEKAGIKLAADQK
jgi:hypothetical protein